METQDTPNLIDVTPNQDGGVLKEIKREGSGDGRPYEGDRVSVHYVGTLANGAVFDSSRDRGEKFEFDLGKGSVIKGWDIGVATMKRGELAVLTCLPEYAYGPHGSAPRIPPHSTLTFEVELIDWHGEDISPGHDGSILRSKVNQGEGFASPKDGSTVEIHLVGTHQGHVFDDRGLTFDLGEGDEHGISEGLEHSLKKFKKGEESILKMKLHHVHRGIREEAEERLPDNAVVEYRVTMKNFEKAKDSWEMDSTEKLDQSDINKTKGTTYFKAGKYRTAAKFYERIVTFLQHEKQLPEEEQSRCTTLLLAAHLNLAACKLKTQDYLPALDHCEKALEMEPKSEKGLYRRGQARLQLQDYEEALADFKALLELDPQNKAAKNQVTITNQKIREAREKERKLYGGMFQKFADVDAKRLEAWRRKNPGADGLNNIGMWDNSMADGMMTIQQEMEAFGEKMPEPKYDSNIDYSKQAEEAAAVCDDDDD